MLVERTWLCRYPHPTIIMHDCGNECLGHAFKNDIIENEKGIKSKCATTDITQEFQYKKNPQSRSEPHT